MTKLYEVFRQKKVFLPVIHPAHGEDGVFKAIDIALNAGAHGVFVINQGMDIDPLLNCSVKIKRIYPDLWLGVNLLGLSPVETLDYAHLFDGIWVDDCGVDNQLSEEELTVGGYRFLETKENWNGLYFGGTAFKTQRQITEQATLNAVAKRAGALTDIVTTSGRATGVAASEEKIKAMRAVLGPSVPIGIASGVTPENIEKYLNDADVFLVASGIEKSFGIFDKNKVEKLSNKIKEQNDKIT